MAVADGVDVAVLGRAAAPGAEAENFDRAIATAEALIGRYCGDAAPAAIRLEATVRTVGYLLSIQPGRPRQQSVGSVQQSIWIPTGSNPLRASGAMSMLSAWKKRRAL